MELRHSASHKATILSALALLKLAIILCHAFSKVGACLDREREALNTFRKALHDPSHLLSSWDQGHDCCKWRGVSCNNDTGYVTKLDLNADADVDSGLSGQIDPALLELKYLQFLDLSYNNFSGSSIPSFLGSMKELRHLNLSWTELSGRIPHQIGNLSNLVSLQLNNRGLSSDNLGWLRNMSSLEYLDMSDVNLLLASHHWVHAIMNGCPSLIELRLPSCHLSFIPPSLSFVNFTSLRVLDISANDFHSIIPNWIANISSLISLDLSLNELSGTIPGTVGGLSSLNELNLERNQLSGSIPETLGGLSSLEKLFLQGNQLNGSIPKALGQLSNLKYLHMSANFLTGNVSEAHFENLRELKELVLNGNPLVMHLQPHWIPPFQLVQLSLDSVNLGPRFPFWLRTQKMIKLLDISNASISDVIPNWLWDMRHTIQLLSLSHNMLSGQLPNALEMMNSVFLDLSWNFLNGSIPCISSPFLDALDLSNNQFSGTMPTNCTYPRKFLSASSNRINGTIPTSICKMSSMAFLDLSNNSLSGTIPETVGNCTSLLALELSCNHLSGSIPRSMGSLTDLNSFHLHGNGLSGELPSSMKNCSSLMTLDLSGNKFYGKIPSWIGRSFTGLRILSLRDNLLTGEIPPQLFHLTSLQFFDVAHNLLCGPIPPNFEDLKAMKNETHDNITNNYFTYEDTSLYYNGYLIVSAKGLSIGYTKTISSLLTCIDLSSNNLSGEIPVALTTLSGLRVLNLSGNHLIGNIPGKIGRLAILESLDLSRNELSGIIPQSISNLYFLSYLNLSHNNLSGRIPSGKQLQALPDPTIYSGNAGLCGFPLSDCGGNETYEGQDGKDHLGEGYHQHEKDDAMFWFYVAIGPGFVVGFWTICGILILKESWRVAYFRLVDDMTDKFYILVKLWMGRLKQKMADGNKISGQ